MIAHLAVFVSLGCWLVSTLLIPPSIGSAPAPPYPAWAHTHMVWLGNTDGNQTSTLQLVNDYLAHGIPVGGVDVDSEWEQGYNNFVTNTQKYPNITQMVATLKQKNINVIFWITSMINKDSSNFQYGLSHGYYLNDGKTIKWWHGEGAFLDYSNPDAVAWWHSLMDNVLDAGVVGWKCDGTDPYVMELVEIKGKKGLLTPHEYGHMYYSDFFDYTRQKAGPDALIWSRPVDALDTDTDYFYWEYSPRNVCFAGWVGDQDPEYHGLEIALNHILESARRKYVNFGSDIGGYRTDKSALGRPRDVFLRWAQLGCFCPLMENGGQGEHRPWMFGDDILTLYRVLAVTHTELGPYLYTTGTNAFYAGDSSMTPVEVDSFLLGKDIFVAPIIKNVTSRMVLFPDEGALWVGYWNKTISYKGGSIKEVDAPLEEIPAFSRSGSIIPMHVTSPYSMHGDVTSEKAITLLVTHPMHACESSDTHALDRTVSMLEPFEWNTITVTMSHKCASSHALHLEVAEGPSRPVMWMITGVPAPRAVDVDNQLVTEVVHTRTEPTTIQPGYEFHATQGIDVPSRQGALRAMHNHDVSWTHETDTQILWVKATSSSSSSSVRITWNL
eukprot:TRINITY_DN6084_c0_g1_i7.p1 TRINITY_DN6084_c0_g1~~TRINITY_DN6084_c0_g1_i7.p1  ORF type:complete len:611 (-),score=124.88 TRINITY_DN6084_c0_g1_i7:34-1866(-)